MASYRLPFDKLRTSLTKILTLTGSVTNRFFLISLRQAGSFLFTKLGALTHKNILYKHIVLHYNQSITHDKIL